MANREEIIEQMQKQYENEFFTFNGFVMNRQQKKELRKRLEKTVDMKLKNINNKMF